MYSDNMTHLTGFADAPDVAEERTLMQTLRALPRAKRPTCLEVLCGCDREHMVASLHPVPNRPEVAAWWVRGGRTTGYTENARSGDLVALVDFVAATLRDAKRPAPRSDLLSFRSVELLAAGQSTLYSGVALCMPRLAFDPEQMGPILARAHAAYLARPLALVRRFTVDRLASAGMTAPRYP